MSKARLVITALLTGNSTVAEVAARYGVHRSWVYRLKDRYDTDGEAAFEPRSRRPRRSPKATSSTTVDLILQLREQLTTDGLDAGADTIAWHLRHHHQLTVSRSTIHRVLTRAGTVTPQPHKRPRSSYIRFEAEQPNETWQSDFTHYRLADGTDVEIIAWLDDHSRFALHLSAHRRVTAPIVHDTFTTTAAEHGYPASTLNENGMVYTVRCAGGRGGRNLVETVLRRLGITQKNSRPNHPTTCGKVERFHQTYKNWLRAQPRQPDTLAELQSLLDIFREQYNHHRPHRSLPHRATPAAAYNRPTQSGPHHGRRPRLAASCRHPQPRPHRQGRHHRHPDPATQRPPPPHRRRQNPRRNPRPAPGPRPRHHHRQRRHRPDPATARPGPQP